MIKKRTTRLNMGVIEDLGLRFPTEKSKKKKRFLRVECDLCKTHFDRRSDTLVKNKKTYCRFCSKSRAGTTHNLSKHKLYAIWMRQKQRCKNKNDKSFHNYGGRGITFSDEFSNFEDWLKYIESLKFAYCEKYSIDRIDNDKGYEKGNLRWATLEVQARNTRRIRKNNTSKYRGVSFCKERGKFFAQITVDSKHIFLGRFKTALEASRHYDEYVIKNNLEHTRNSK